jgi:integrase
MDLYERTGDVLLVQKALRHRSLESTMVYARADDRRLRVAMHAHHQMVI